MNIHFFKKLYKVLLIGFFVSPSLMALTASDELKKCKAAVLAQLNQQKRVAATGCPVSQQLIVWLGILRDPTQFSPQELITFLNSHHDWPQHTTLSRKAEEVIVKGSQGEIYQWFSQNPPQTPAGAMAFAKVLMAKHQNDKATKVIGDAWKRMDLSLQDEKKISAQFGHLLQEKDYIARVNHLLWEENVADAKRVMHHVPVTTKKIAEARMAFLAGRSDAIQKMKALPVSSLKDEGLVYEAVKWHRKRGNFDDAAVLLIKTPSSHEYAQKWWKERNYIAREFIALKDYRKAHDVITKNGLKPGDESFSDAKWLMGWLDLRFLNRLDEARHHFENLFANVKGAISKARGAYWVGRVYEAQGNYKLAGDWFKQGAHYKTTYYGQLSASKIGENAYPTLKSAPTIASASEEKKRFEGKDLVKAAYILKGLGSGAKHELNKFILQVASNAKTNAERELAVHLAYTLSPYDAVWGAKKAGYEEPVLLKKAFPTYQIPRRGQKIPEDAFVMAIIYQETRFDPSAQSSAGAMGLMQLMPATAAHEAKRLGVKHSKAKLFDPQHNLHLGTAHLSRMLSTFGDSYILTAVAYNAGPHVAKRWITEMGHPSKGKIDVVDWVELIPYHETRNYVMRVLENVTNYRSLMQGHPKSTLVHDLKR